MSNPDNKVYEDLEKAQKAIREACIELIRGNEHEARKILIEAIDTI